MNSTACFINIPNIEYVITGTDFSDVYFKQFEQILRIIGYFLPLDTSSSPSSISTSPSEKEASLSTLFSVISRFLGLPLPRLLVFFFFPEVTKSLLDSQVMITWQPFLNLTSNNKDGNRLKYGYLTKSGAVYNLLRLPGAYSKCERNEVPDTPLCQSLRQNSRRTVIYLYQQYPTTVTKTEVIVH